MTRSLARMVCVSGIVFVAGANGHAAVVDRSAAWPPGSTLTVCFMDGTIAQHQRILSVASEWTQAGNIRFDSGSREEPRRCRESTTSDIRISILGNGNWSYIGTQAKRVGFDKPTMTLEIASSSNASRDDASFRMQVLHEFGHSLGYLHESQSPVSLCEYDNQAIKEGTRWTDDEIAQTFRKLEPSPVYYVTAFDPTSVMMYSIFSYFLVGKENSPCFIRLANSKLSATDAAAMSVIYGPPSDVQTASPPVPVASAVSFRRTVDQAGLLNAKIIQSAMAIGFSDASAIIDPEHDARIKLGRLAQKTLVDAGDALKEAVAACNRRDFRTCQWQLLEPANRGNTDAQIILAYLTFEGSGTVPQEYGQAAKWLGAAAGSDAPVSALAKYILALMHQGELGLKRDPQKIEELLQAAGQAGLSEGYIRLGQIYVADQNEPHPDFEKAASFFAKAAAQGDAVAKMSLAVLSLEGLIQHADQIDPVAALDAATDQISWAKLYEALLYADGVAKPKDPERARQLLEVAATGGLSTAQAIQGFSCETGQLNPPDFAQAARWYGAAADQKNAIAQYRLAALIESGKIKRGNYPEPATLWQDAANSGFPQAQYKLALAYRDGGTLPLDDVLAAAWLITAVPGLSGGQQEQARAERDQLASKLGPRYRLAQDIARSIRLSSPWGGSAKRLLPVLITPGRFEMHDWPIVSQGSGFFFAKGYVITNHHVIDHEDAICFAKIPDGDEQVLDKPISDKQHDLAIMKLPYVDDTPAARWKFGVRPPVGVRAAGFPLPGILDSSAVSLEPGEILAAGGIAGDFSRWRINAKIHKGNSGGPIFDEYGNVVGVAVSGLNDDDGRDIAFAFKGSLVNTLFGDRVEMDTSATATRLTESQIQELASKLVVPVSCRIHVGQRK